jgi:hypothetical protein
LSAGKFRSLSGLRADSARRATKTLVTPSNPFRPRNIKETASDHKGRSERLRILNLRLAEAQVEFRYLFACVDLKRRANESLTFARLFGFVLAQSLMLRSKAISVVGLFLHSNWCPSRSFAQRSGHHSAMPSDGFDFSEILYFQLLGGFVYVI